MSHPQILRDFQQRAIEALFNHHHLVLISPTGSGKSLVFQKFIELNRETARVVFVSPLNALARQQARRFSDQGFKVWTSVGNTENFETTPNGPGIWVLNPEQLVSRAWRSLKQFKPDFLVVDEAHCIWEWGDQFRPAFRSVLELVSEFHFKRSLWCTATLPPPSLAEIRSALPNAHVVMGEFSLPQNLSVKRLRTSYSSRMAALQKILQDHSKQSGIVFVATRSVAERLARHLGFLNFRCVFYHAGMSQEERKALEYLLESLNDDTDQPVVVIATSAFGMGMDYAFLRFCILFGPAFNLLALAQSIGRVGRGTQAASAYVLWHEDDFLRLTWLTHDNEARKRELNYVHQWCKTSDCPREFLENYFNGSSESGTLNT